MMSVFFIAYIMIGCLCYFFADVRIFARPPLKTCRSHLTPWRLGGFGNFRKKNQPFSVALPTP